MRGWTILPDSPQPPTRAVSSFFLSRSRIFVNFSENFRPAVRRFRDADSGPIGRLGLAGGPDLPGGPGEQDLLDGDVGFPGSDGERLERDGLGRRGGAIRATSCWISVSSSVYLIRSASSDSAARPMSSCCLLARPAARAAEAARPTLAFETVLRPSRAPRTDVPTAMVASQVDRLASACSRSSRSRAARILSSRAAIFGLYAPRSFSISRSRRSRDAWATRRRNSRSASVGREVILSFSPYRQRSRARSR